MQVTVSITPTNDTYCVHVYQWIGLLNKSGKQLEEAKKNQLDREATDAYIAYLHSIYTIMYLHDLSEEEKEEEIFRETGINESFWTIIGASKQRSGTFAEQKRWIDQFLTDLTKTQQQLFSKQVEKLCTFVQKHPRFQEVAKQMVQTDHHILYTELPVWLVYRGRDMMLRTLAYPTLISTNIPSNHKGSFYGNKSKKKRKY